MKIYLATWLLEASQGNSLTKQGQKKRLLSFYHTVEKKKDFRRYIRTGMNNKL